MLFTHYYVQGVAPHERQQVLVSSEYHTSLTTVLQLMSPLAPHITSQLWEGELTELYIYPWAVSYYSLCGVRLWHELLLIQISKQLVGYWEWLSVREECYRNHGLVTQW